MATTKPTPKKEETKKADTEKPAPEKTDDIVQPSPNDKDPQDSIRENAKKGQPIHVPNT